MNDFFLNRGGKKEDRLLKMQTYSKLFADSSLSPRSRLSDFPVSLSNSQNYRGSKTLLVLGFMFLFSFILIFLSFRTKTSSFIPTEGNRTVISPPQTSFTPAWKPLSLAFPDSVKNLPLTMSDQSHFSWFRHHGSDLDLSSQDYQVERDRLLIFYWIV